MPTGAEGQVPSLTDPYVVYSPFDQLFQYWQNFQVGFFDFLMRFIAAAIVVIVGFLVAWIVEWIIRWLVENLKINEFLRNAGMATWLERANVELKTEKFLGSLAFWIIWVLFWMPALDLLNLSAFNQFLSQLLRYLPTAVVGGLIIVAGVFLAEFIRKLVETILKGSRVQGAGAAGTIVYWAVIIFALAASLSHLGVARDFINILLSGFIALIALAGGLAFGLGGQDLARDILSKIKREISH
jgi:hypothetical protein